MSHIVWGMDQNEKKKLSSHIQTIQQIDINIKNCAILTHFANSLNSILWSKKVIKCKSFFVSETTAN